MSTLTNNTKQTPLGIGSMGVVVEPGQSVEVDAKAFKAAALHPVVAGWVKDGLLTLSDPPKQPAKE